MRNNHFLAAIAFAGLSLVPANAFAEHVNIKQDCSYSCLKAACANVGGIFYGNSSRYTCNNEKKGTRVECTYTANGSVCGGDVPLKAGKGGISKGGIIGVLKPPVGGKAPPTGNPPKGKGPVVGGIRPPARGISKIGGSGNRTGTLMMRAGGSQHAGGGKH